MLKSEDQKKLMITARIEKLRTAFDSIWKTLKASRYDPDKERSPGPILFRHLGRANYPTKPYRNNVKTNSRSKDRNDVIVTTLARKYETDLLAQPSNMLLEDADEWFDLVVFDNFVMNTTDYYSNLATKLTVFWQIWIRAKQYFNKRWGDYMTEESSNYDQSVFDEVFGTEMEAFITSKFIDKNGIYEPGSPILFSSTDDQFTNKKKFPDSFVEQDLYPRSTDPRNVKTWRDSAFFGYVKEKAQTKNGTYEIDIPLNRSTNYTLDTEKMIWNYNMKKITVTGKAIGDEQKNYRFFDTESFPLDQPARYRETWILE